MATDNPLVSIGIPTFNRPKTLERTLQCICGQSYKNLEIIVSDNCSPGEETYFLVKSFQKQDPRIKYYRQDRNLGMTLNSAFTVAKASGKYFMYANDDDEWYPDYVKKCVEILENNETVILCTTKWIIVSDVILKRNIKDLDKKQRKFKQTTPFWLINDDVNSYGLTPIKRIKKTILTNYSGFSAFGIYRTSIWKHMVLSSINDCNRFGSDRSFLVRLSLLGPIYQIPEPLFVYHHGLGISSNDPLEKNDRMPLWEYYGLRIHPLLTGYINMIIDSLFLNVSVIDHIRIIGYYLGRMAKAKYLRYFSKTPFVGTPLHDYKPPEYPKRKDI